MKIATRLPAGVLATAAVSCAMAWGAETSFGLQAIVSQPLGELRTLTGDGMGFGIGAHLLVDLGGGRAVRPRLDYLSYPGRVGYFRMEQFSGGADYLYFREGKTSHGTYLVAGAGVASNNYQTFQPSFARAYTNPYVALGAGYQLNGSWGIEVRYKSSRYTDQAGYASPVNALGLAATIRF